jgi:hypothetical protein
MKKIFCLSVLLLTGTALVAQKANQNNAAQANDNKVPQEIRYKEGSSGVKRSINYRFDPSNSDSDPGTGSFRYNSETISKVTFLYVNNSDLSGEDQSKWYKTWDDTTGATGRGRISVVEYQGSNVNVFDVSGVFIRAGGFWKIPVEYVSGSRPAAGATYYYVFQRIAHKKDAADKDEEPVIAEAVKPAEQPKPAEEVKPVEQPKPAEEVKPVEQPKPAEEAKPVEQSKPAEEAKPVEQPKPAEEAKPVEQPKPAEEAKPVEQPKPAEEAKPIEQPKPPEEAKPVEQPKPADEAKPIIEQPNPLEEAKPVEQPKPEAKPVEQPKPLEEKPVTQVADAQPTASNSDRPARQTSRETANRTLTPSRQASQSRSTGTQSATQTQTQSQTQTQTQTQTRTQQQAATQTRTQQQSQTQTRTVTQTTENKSQPVQNSAQATQKSGTTWTSQVTQGVQPSQEQPAQSYQNTQNNRLPSYGYNFSSNKRGHGKCYAGIIEVGYGFGMGDYGLDNFRFNFINGFHIGPTFTLGLGIGVRRYYPEHENFTNRELVSKVLIPVFIDMRKTFSTRTVTPYLALDLGGAARYSSGSQSEETVNEGLLINPSGGIWINLSSRFAVFGGIGYEVQKMQFCNTSHDSYVKKNAGSLSINLGISF